MLKKMLLATAMAASLGGVMAPALSSDVIVVEKAPPPVREEVIPAPRAGYIWSRGYWDWRGNEYVWVPGSWIRERPGFVHHQAEWRERDGKWEMVRETWIRDDNAPRRADRDPDSPNRN